MKFCKKPFESIHLDPNGRCRVCGWTDASLGNLVNEELEDIWKSKEANIIREAVKHGNYEYCREVSCPFLENDSLPDLTEAEIEKESVVEELPSDYSVACDFICNHSCPSCRPNVFVPDEQYRKNLQIIIDKIVPVINKTAKSFITDGNGDCFASPYMMNMLERIKPENPNCKIAFETNGALFDEAHWNRIKHLAKHDIEITVTPNSFQKMTFKYLNGGHDTYEQVICNLRFMRDLKREGLINKINISIVTQEKNYCELPEFAQRSIEEFEADEVIVKPLYKWFELTPDEYWHKDVLNPLHPYHEDFKKVLEDSRLKDPRVYFWGGHHMHKPSKHPAYIFQEHMEFIGKLFTSKEAFEELKIKLKNMGIESLYIYGDMEMSPILYQIFKENDIHIKGIVARDVIHKEICGETVVKFCDYIPNDEDTMLVLRHDFMEKIERDFHFIGFTGKMITIRDLN